MLEADIWQTAVAEPGMRAGRRQHEILLCDLGDRMSELTERAIIAMYHLPRTRAWIARIIEGSEQQLAAAGLYRLRSARRRGASSTSAAIRA